MTLKNPVAVHLKDINRGEVWVLKQVVDLRVGVEGGPLGVDGDGLAVGDIANRTGQWEAGAVISVTRANTGARAWSFSVRFGPRANTVARASRLAGLWLRSVASVAGINGVVRESSVSGAGAHVQGGIGGAQGTRQSLCQGLGF